MLDPAQIKLIHAQRKSLSVRVVDIDQLEVRAPIGTSQAEVMASLAKHEAKINRMLEQYAKAHQVHFYSEGSTILFMGEALSIKYIPGFRYSWKLEDCLYVNAANQDSMPQLLHGFYTAQAQRLVLRARLLGAEHDFPMVKISTRWCKSRWGSCSRSGNISLNSALIMALPAVIDYVIIHEYCHLKHRNHALPFWQSVEHILPDYRQQYAWLKEHGHLLKIQPASSPESA